MRPEVLNLRVADDPQAVISQVAERLNHGAVVALPTETVYGLAASALRPDSVQRLVEIKGRQQAKPLALGLKSRDEAAAWVPADDQLGQRLVRRCLPGPVTLVFTQPVGRGRLCTLPEPVQGHVCPADTIGLRVPAHTPVLDCLSLLPAPIVLTSANLSGQSPAVAAEQAITAFGGLIDLVLDDGPCRYGQPSSVVRVHGSGWQMLRQGVVPPSTLERVARCVILFVCTGNTCRSPMAEGLCKRLLAERLGCRLEQLPEHGYEVLSAGVAAWDGGVASREAVAVMSELGLDLSDHMAQAVTAEMVFQADHVIAMTRDHLEILRGLAPAAAERMKLLRRDGGDIADPVGMGVEAYRAAARDIAENLEYVVAELLR